ncbi:TetR family transcriptional regulator [Paenibacillus cymbidii]|uniref:TetR family transcriptional regulator n=1 Tax=Paenibacillus cymbidii TaxID=1639034 RepID=UPI001081F8A3|nr:TetR family transcriptional regulator [Paenibacillus cymbidii]
MKGKTTRGHIIESADRMFYERGYEYTSFAEIADAMQKLSMHLLARSQGIATLAQAFRDERFIKHEVVQLYSWLSSQLARTTQVEGQ